MKQVWIDIAADSANTHLPATIQHVRPTATPPAVEGLRATQQAAASVVATAAAAAAEGASIAGADDGSAAGLQVLHKESLPHFISFRWTSLRSNKMTPVQGQQMQLMK